MTYDKEQDIDSDYETALADGQVHILTPKEIKHRCDTWSDLLEACERIKLRLDTGGLVTKNTTGLYNCVGAAIAKAETVE